MLLKTIKLNNIRSYENAEINFPTGSTLLSGDIGAGKSTILLATEFALFGTRRTNLSGASLLRNGEDKGSVELSFEIENKNITIQRNLSRGKKAISQDAGHIEIDGERKDLSTVELKQEIINLLNYPQEVLTKSKDLIYRYTVYTPQEEMKHILLENPSERLDILRRVFGIEKYKTIINNTKFFVSKIKLKVKEFTGVISDLEEKKSSKEEFLIKIKNLEESLFKIIPLHEENNKKINSKKEEIKLIEDKITKLNEIKTKVSVKNTKLESSLSQIERNKNEVNNLEIKNTEIKEVPNSEELIKQIETKKEEISSLNKKLDAIKNTIRTYEIKIEHAKDIKGKFHDLDVCPTCKQLVGDEYKSGVFSEQDKIVLESESNLKNFSSGLQLKEEGLESLNKELDALREKEREIELIKLKLKSFEEKKLRKTKLEEENIFILKEVNSLKLELEELNKEVQEFTNLNEVYSKLKLDLDSLLEELRRIESEKVGFEREVVSTKEFVSTLDKEIVRKERIKLNIIKLIDLQFFLEKEFVNLMEVIEKKIMLKAFSDFDKLFRDWFEILIDNELLKIRIDESFTPVIEQNGYDIDYLHLSGGEKTAAALAYRLALNQVINNLMTSIRTKDLIILDEPTDGFSEAQLDRLRIVLESLDIKQVILVSHESKIESFVENIIKLSKKDHVSLVD